MTTRTELTTRQQAALSLQELRRIRARLGTAGFLQLVATVLGEPEPMPMPAVEAGTNGRAQAPEVVPINPKPRLWQRLTAAQKTHRRGKGLVRHIQQWGRQRGYPHLIRDWDADQVAEAEAEARAYLKGEC